MTNRIIPPGAPEFVALFDTFTREAFQMETLQVYRGAGEDADVDAFLTDRSVPDGGHSAWLDMVRRNTAAGRVMRRVHVFVEPLTDYARYEVCWPYSACCAAGEDIRIVTVTDRRDVPAGGDWWLFDDDHLYRQHHGDDGCWLGTEPVPDAASARVVRDRMWSLATPWADYVTTRPDLVARLPRHPRPRPR